MNCQALPVERQATRKRRLTPYKYTTQRTPAIDPPLETATNENAGNLPGTAGYMHASPPPRLPPIDTLPRTLHLPVRAPPDRGIIAIQHPLLALVRLAEGVPPLLPHALHLPHLPDGLLELLHARPVVLDVVLLDLLHVVVRLRPVHALGVLPREVAQEAERRQEHHHQVEDRRREQLRDHALVLGRQADLGRDEAVDGQEDEPDDHAAGDGDEGVLGPDVGHERGLAEHRRQHGRVHHRAPDPVAG